MAETKKPIIPNLILAVSGEAKTGKTHLALTFPAPIIVFSFDFGVEALTKSFSGKEITIINYELPLVETVRAVGQKKQVLGVWQKFRDDYNKATEGGAKTLVVDTATAAYEVCRIGRTGELGRELDPTEYGDVYMRMKALIQRVRLSGQNLVLTHYLKDVYQGTQPTGEKRLDGFRYTESEVDVSLYTRLETALAPTKEDPKHKKSQIVTTVGKSRYDALNVTGLELVNTDYAELIAVLGLEL